MNQVKFLDLNRQYLSIKEEVDAKLLGEIERCQFINGQSKEYFEQRFASYIGTSYCLGVGNGTDALEIGIRSLNLPEGSEVLVQGNTFIATCIGVTYAGLKNKFVDVDENTLMIDLDDLESKITENTKAVIVVHLYGTTCNMKRLVDICKDHNLILIEDCAQSHGAKFNGQKLGTFGELSCFSFYPGKNLGAYGDGGAICTNNENLYKFCKKYANLGSDIKYHHEIFGRNSRLDTVQAIILDTKLNHLDIWNARRRQIADIYKNKINNQYITHLSVVNGVEAVYHLYVVKVKNRKAFVDHMNVNGIQTLVHYPIPVHKSEAYENHNNDNLPVCERTCEEIVSLPIYAELEDDEINRICTVANTFQEIH